MAAHSKIGASSMYRWAACPGSVRLSENAPPQAPSPYAEEGTRAHEIAAEILLGKILPDADAEMLEAVKVYTDYCIGIWEKREWTESIFMIEHRFDLSKVHPGLFGTADCVIFDAKEKRLHVIDYKHGIGIPVEVREEGKPNSQLMYYGLGALLSSGVGCREVVLTIVQPRCAHPDGPIRSLTVPTLDLLDFAADLVEFAKRTEDPNAPLHPGDHCRFCPAAPICPALEKKANLVAREEFSPVFSYDPEKLAQTLTALPMLEAYIKSVREFAYGEALHGRVPPGFKLVDKRATRKWRDEHAAISELQKSTRLPAHEILDQKLKSPAQIEKLLPKDLKSILEPLVVAESSGTSLVPDTDRRANKALSAKAEFSDIN